MIIPVKKILAMHDERVKIDETAENAVLGELQEKLNIVPGIVRPLWLNQVFSQKM